MRIRIKDIAEKAKVSTGTVDRVLHGREGVSEKTRQKVHKIINRFNYEPDILASNLAQKRIYKIAVLLPGYNNKNPFWKYPQKGLDKALSDNRFFNLDVKLFCFDQFDKSSFIKNSASITKDTYDAVILSPMFPDISEFLVEQLEERNIPYVFINSSIEKANPLSYIGQDVKQSGFLAAKLLGYGLNETNELMVMTIARQKDNFEHYNMRINGFKQYFSEKNKKNKIYEFVVNDNEADIKNMLIDNLTDKKKIKAIFVNNSRVYKVAKILEQSGIQEIRVLGYDLLEQNIKYLKKNYIDFLISQKPEKQGYQSIITIVTNIILKKDVPLMQHIPIDIITKENIDYYINLKQ